MALFLPLKAFSFSFSNNQRPHVPILRPPCSLKHPHASILKPNIIEQIKDGFAEGKDLVVTVMSAMGEEQICALKDIGPK